MSLYNATDPEYNMEGSKIELHCVREVLIYDSLGKQHAIKIVFSEHLKEINNISNVIGQLSYGTLIFNGKLDSISDIFTSPMKIFWTNGSKVSHITLDLGKDKFYNAR
ncbi:MAG: hypothetical protein AB8U25_05265 [Rickettsiales endosymbiont of Dermacentor nuttalli]